MRLIQNIYISFIPPRQNLISMTYYVIKQDELYLHQKRQYADMQTGIRLSSLVHQLAFISAILLPA